MVNSTIIQDTANYKCIATNEVGSVNSSIAQVLIYGKISLLVIAVVQTVVVS